MWLVAKKTWWCLIRDWVLTKLSLSANTNQPSVWAKSENRQTQTTKIQNSDNGRTDGLSARKHSSKMKECPASHNSPSVGPDKNGWVVFWKSPIQFNGFSNFSIYFSKFLNILFKFLNLFVQISQFTFPNW